MIEINNLTANPVDGKFLKKVAKFVLEREKKETKDLSIVLVGQGRIRELNKKYRGKNRVTDVLAFSEKEIPKSRFKVPKSIAGLGEIVICSREVKKNTKIFSSTFKKELARVLIHGILHLLGYNHEKTEKKAEKMQKKEEYYLSQINY